MQANQKIFFRAKVCSTVVILHINSLRERVFRNVHAFYEKKYSDAGMLKASSATDEKKRKSEIVAYERRKFLRPRLEKDRLILYFIV